MTDARMMKGNDAGGWASAGRRRAALGRLAACLLVLGAAAPARAEWDDGYVYEYEQEWEPPMRWAPRPAPYPAPRGPRPVYAYPLNEVDDLPPRGVVRMLRGRGFRDIAPPRAQGRVYVVDATEPGERRVRLAVHRLTGLIVSRRLVGSPAAAPAPAPRVRAASVPRPAPAPRQRQAARVEPQTRPAPTLQAPAPLPPSRPGEAASPAAEARPAEPPPSPQAGWVTPPPRARLGPPRRVRPGEEAARTEERAPRP